MATDITVMEKHLVPLEHEFSQALEGSGISFNKLLRTAVWSVQNGQQADKLLQCAPSSLIRYAMTVASLALDPNPNVGQIFPVAFNKRGDQAQCQTIIGYRGYNTLGARAGVSIDGEVVREGDDFEFELGTGGFIRHRPQLGHRNEREIIAAWATATAKDRPPVVVVMDIDEILEIKKRSPAARSDSGSFSPWNDTKIGFPAMAAKTAKRRLARSVPFGQLVVAAAMEEAFEERGESSYISPTQGLIVGGQAQPAQPRQPEPTAEESHNLGRPPQFPIKRNDGSIYQCASVNEWEAKMLLAIKTLKTAEGIEKFRDNNSATADVLRDEDAGAVNRVYALIEKRLGGK